MTRPFKMKYTDGKKASPSKMFTSVASLGSIRKSREKDQGVVVNEEQDPITRKIDEKVEEKVDEVVNQKTNEGLV